jgi:excisionase family DNA binding protein
VTAESAVAAVASAVAEALANDPAFLAAIAKAVAAERPPPEPATPYMTIVEAAAYLRCARHRVDDLLSQRRLTRIHDGRRVLIERAEVDRYLRGDRQRVVVASARGPRTR